MTTRALNVVLAGRTPATLFLLAFTLAACGSGGGGGGGKSASPQSLFGPAQLISVDAPGVGSLAAADLDGDGDGDVLAVSQDDGSVTWYENADGNGGAWIEHTISSTAAGANTVAAADLDCDGDIDAVATSYAAGVRWYENRDGLGLDWADHLISNAPSQPMGLFLGDFDLDGHQDVLCGSFAGGAVLCFLNVGGLGTSWTPRTVASGESAPLAVGGASLDGGDCFDALVATAYSSELSWHDNTSCLASGWPKSPIASGLATPIALLGADADGDGDNDVVTASMSGDRIDLHRNLDGLGSEWNLVAIATGLDGVRAIWAGDLDCDGDIDVLSAAEVANAVSWHENMSEDGGIWSTHAVSTLAQGVTAVLGADIDGDGLIDAVSASTGAATIEWYHNQLPGEGFTLDGLDDQTACAGSTVSFAAAPVGPGPFTYEWTRACSGAVVGSGASLVLDDVGPQDAGVYELSVTSGFRTLSQTVRLIVLDTVTATDPPDLTVCAGTPVTLATTAGGSGPFTYAWTRVGSSSVLGSAASLPLGSVGVSNAGTYSVTVTGACGTAQQSVVLAVNAPAVATDPVDQIVCLGGSAHFSTTASGTGPFSFQWTKVGSPTVLSTTSTLALGSLGAADSGTYRVAVTGACGTTTQDALLTVATELTTTSPGDVSACAGGTVTLSTEPTGAGPFTFQWTKAGSNEPLGHNSSLTLFGVGPSDVGVYTVAVAGACGTTSQSGSVLLNQPLSISKPLDQQACPGTPVTFSTSASGSGPFSYRWTRAGSSVVLSTSSVLALGPVNVASAGTYTVTVAGPCSETSEDVTLAVNEPTAAAPLQNQSVKTGTAGVTIGPITPTGTGPFTYVWTRNGSVIAGATGPELDLGLALPEDAGNYCVTVAGACGSATQCAQLEVQPLSPSDYGGRKLGSLLIFPLQRSSGGSTTVISVTNTDTQVKTPVSLGGSTNLHFEYVNATANPANPFRPLSCDVFDRVESLSPADTLAVSTACHNPSAAGLEGYLIVSAQDPTQFNVPWSHNSLIGSELVVTGSGLAFELEAIMFSAVPQGGQPTDLDADGNLDLNGREYTPVAETLAIPAFLAVAQPRLTLINLTGSPSDVNTVQFSVWNDNEFQLSAQVQFSCWFDQPLLKISPLFTQGVLLGTPNDPNELDANCDGVQDIEMGWVRIDSVGVATPGGDLVAPDGALVGATTGSDNGLLTTAELLWESNETQDNGAATTP